MKAVKDSYTRQQLRMAARCFLIGRDKEKCMLDEGCPLLAKELKEAKALLPICGQDHQPLLKHIRDTERDVNDDECRGRTVVALAETEVSIVGRSGLKRGSSCAELKAVKDSYTRQQLRMAARCFLIGRDKEKCMLDEGCPLLAKELKEAKALLPICGQDHQPLLKHIRDTERDVNDDECRGRTVVALAETEVSIVGRSGLKQGSSCAELKAVKDSYTRQQLRM